MKKNYSILLLLVCVFFSLSAQTKNEFQIGLATPSGDFADDDADDAIFDGAGVAASGFYLGYKSLTPLSTKGLYWTFSAGLMYNGLNSDFQDDIEDEIEDSYTYDGGIESTFSKYLNIPLLVGLQYEAALSPTAKLFGEAGIGLNILKLTNMSYSYDYYYSGDVYDYEFNCKFKPSIKMGYKIGGGILINDKYTVGLTYLGLGSHKVKYTVEESIDGDNEESDEEKFDRALSISSLNFVFGLRF